MSGLVELARFQTQVQADLARLLLEVENIDAVLFDEGMAYVGLGPLIPVRLMVLEEDVADATAILRAEGIG